MLFALLRDLRSSLRAFLRRPAFPAAVVTTLAVAIGANTAMFTVVHAVLISRLPFRDADRLVVLHSREPGSDRQPFSIADYLDLKENARSVDALAAWAGGSANLTGVEEPVALRAQWTSSGFFELLGVRAALGRIPLPAEERPGAPRVVLLGHALWTTRFGADPAVLGRVVTINGEPFTVIGILPREFPFLAGGADLAAPVAYESDPRRANRGAGFLRLIGRLRPGIPLSQASEDFNALAAALKAEHADANANREGIRVSPLAEQVVGGYRRILLVLQAAVGVVLLIACANLANLLLSRILARRSELALRSALGARRSDLVRRLLAEAVVLALAGGALGLLLAHFGIRALLALGPGTLPRAEEIGIDLSVLAFNLALSLAAGITIGFAPALQGSGRGFAKGLRGSGRGASGSRRSARARAALVAAEVGLSLVLLVGAGLLLRTLHRLQTAHPGFQARNLVAVQLSLPKSRYGTPEAIQRYAERVTERLAGLPGVSRVAAASLNPLTNWRASVSFLIEGSAELDRREAPLANYRAAGAGYFRTLGVPLREGREFDSRDSAESVPVALVSETLARQRFGNASPLGARLRIDDTEAWRTVEIVGVVGDVKHTGLDAEGTADVYVPFAQTPPDLSVWLANIFCVAVRTIGDPRLLVSSVRREIQTLDRDVAAASIRPMEEALDASLGDRRFQTTLLELFGAAALALALAGIYCVTSFGVVERTREIGVRLSLGAGRRRIFALFLRQALTPVGAGLLSGGAAAVGLARLLRGLLVGVVAHDAATLIASTTLLTATAFVASAVPALRATRIDPVRALRAD
jgi:putative ABC transport system permease protein